jgi:site-specific DNA recombinase
MHNNTYAIYCRISADRRGTELGVQRQEEACRQLAERNGLNIYTVIVDNDISAYSGKRRPGYEQLLELMRSDQVHGVIALHSDRLHRSPTELEDFISICDSHRIDVKTVQAGVIDLSTASGRMGARIYGAVARHEVEHTIERQKAAKLQAAKAGLPSGGNRAYGYEQNGMVIIDKEADIIREATERFISGDSWRSIALDFNARGIPTAKGNMWNALNVHNVCNRKRNISIRTHNTDEYPAQWPSLVDLETWEDLQVAIKRGQAIYGNRTYARKHLLTGFIFCALCGNSLTIINAQARDGSYQPAYNCRKKDHRGLEVGCGKVKRKQAPVEDLVIDCLIYRLDSPELGSMVGNSKSASPRLKQLLRDQEIQQQRLTEILNLYSTGVMELVEYTTAKTIAKSRLAAISKQVDAMTSTAILANVPLGQTLRQTWDKADLEWKRQLLDVVIEKIFVHPRQLGDGKAKYKQWIFNPDRVEIRWKA